MFDGHPTGIAAGRVSLDQDPVGVGPLGKRTGPQHERRVPARVRLPPHPDIRQPQPRAPGRERERMSLTMIHLAPACLVHEPLQRDFERRPGCVVQVQPPQVGHVQPARRRVMQDDVDPRPGQAHGQRNQNDNQKQGQTMASHGSSFAAALLFMLRRCMHILTGVSAIDNPTMWLYRNAPVLSRITLGPDGTRQMILLAARAVTPGRIPSAPRSRCRPRCR